MIRISEGSERQIAKWAMDSDMIIGLEQFILSGRPNSLGALKAWVSTKLENHLVGSEPCIVGRAQVGRTSGQRTFERVVNQRHSRQRTSAGNMDVYSEHLQLKY